MGKIQRLDDALVNQIAAGEVVERPASVVKELLDNALDAGATNVTVELTAGGLGAIRIVDDGEGMTLEDALLAVERHATSKIRRVEDLEAIATLGFRGEALASIASVSRFALVTRTAEASEGVRVEVDAQGTPRATVVGAPRGTSVEVEDLFYNVPARRKFLKSQATESAHVGEVCARVALANPAVRLVVVRDGKRVREYLPAPSLLARAGSVLDDDVLTEIEAERGPVQLVAALSAPERARNGAVQLHLFVNGRAVRDRALARAVAFAYGSVLPQGRYPTGVVHVFVDPRLVDVNVHPQKSEVRFASAATVLDAVSKALSAELARARWSEGAPQPIVTNAQFWQERLPRGPVTAVAEDATTSYGGAFARAPAADADESSTAARTGAQQVASLADGPAQVAQPRAAPSLAQASSPHLPLRAPSKEALPPRLRPLAQVRAMLIVCEGDDGLYVVDQHAADERVVFARLSSQYHARNVTMQRLLFPERVELATHEVARLEGLHDSLLALGIDATPIGATTAAVHAVPALLRRAAPARLLRDLFDELGAEGTRAFGDAVDTALATMACHAAIRAGDTLTVPECTALMRALDEVDAFAGHCPHGRPVIVRMTFDELERKLGR